MKKIVVIGVIALFIGVGFTSVIGVNVEQISYSLNVGELAWWKFDETSGNIAHDSSGHGYDGTVYGATWTGGGLIFDGIDDYVDFDDHSVALGMNKTDDYMVIVRFKSTGSGMLYSMSHTNLSRAYFDLMLDEEGKITVEIGDETCLFTLSSLITVNDGDWHSVEIYFEGSATNPTLEIYVDDELDGSITDWIPPMLDEDFLTDKVGRNSNTEEDYFDGYIDDIKIYKSGHPPPPPPLTISGPDSGKPGQKLTYVFSIVYPVGSWICNIDWGDGNHEHIFADTDSVTVSHVWNAQGNYIITAYAEDWYGNDGPSTTKQVTIPRDKSTNNILMLRILDGFPLFQKLIQLGFGL